MKIMSQRNGDDSVSNETHIKETQLNILFITYLFSMIFLLKRKIKRFNPHLPNGLSYPYQLGGSIFHLRGIWYTSFIFIIFLIENSASKQCRPWSDIAFSDVWSGSALFAYVPKMEP